MSATLVTPKTASGGEIIRELIYSSDGQGLAFDGVSSHISLASSAGAKFGTSDFSLEFILNQTKESTDETYYFTAPYTGDNRMGFWYDKTNTTLKIYFRATSNTHYAFDYDIAADFGTPTHFVVTADRDGNATLYKNGNSVGSVDISGSSAVNIGDSNANPFYISANAASTAIIGSLYRFRTWNKALTQAEVDNAYQRADVDFADQYGSQTELSTNSYTNSGFAGFSGSATGFTASGSASGNNAWKNQSFTDGKKYRMKFTVTDGESANLEIAFRSSTGGSGSNTGTIVSSTKGNISGNFLQFTETGAYEVILSDLGSAQSIRIYAGGDVGAVNISGFGIVQIGAVTDYDLAFANPSQSLMVQDRAGAADGTASASGVSQTQKIVQLNATAISVSNATARTPSDGAIVADSLGIGTVSSFTDSQAAIVGGDNVGLALQSTHSGKTSRVRFFDNAGNQDATIGFDNSTSNLFMGTGTNAHLQIDSSGNVTQVSVNSGGDVTAFQLRNGAAATSTSTSLRFVNSTVATATHGGAELTSIRNANDGGSLVFKTAADTSTTLTERMRIDSAGKVEILSNGASNNPASLSLWAKDTSIAGGDEIGTLLGQGSDNAASPPLTGAKINFTADHAWDGGTANYQSTRIDFFTQDNSGTDTLTDPRMTIGSTGNVGAGNTAPNGAMEVSRGGASTESIISTWSAADVHHSELSFKKSGSSTVNTKAVTASGEPLGAINSYGVDTNSDQRRAARIEFNQAAAATGSKVAGNMVFKTSSTSANDVTALTIDSDGASTFTGTVVTPRLGVVSSNAGYELYNNANTYLNGTTTLNGLVTCNSGIAFQSATGGTGTGTGYTLDKYEIGTFTGSLTAATPPTSVPTATGNYTRIGNLVHIQIRFANVDTSGASGGMEVTGLPFTSANTNDSNVANTINGQFYNLPWLPSNPTISRNANKVIFVSQNDGGAWSSYNISANSGVYLHIAGTYVV